MARKKISYRNIWEYKTYPASRDAERRVGSGHCRFSKFQVNAVNDNITEEMRKHWGQMGDRGDNGCNSAFGYLNR
jgi:hypothetical protein